MPPPGLAAARRPLRSLILLIFCLAGLSAVHTGVKDVLQVPRLVSLTPNLETQQLSISWMGGAATTFDIIILRRDFNQTVFYGTVYVPVHQPSGLHQWNWTSAEPLECTSLAVKVCARDGRTTSPWSSVQELRGQDEPSNTHMYMYPQDRLVVVGTNTTFCCVTEEGGQFGYVSYGKVVMDARRISNRSYVVTAFNQGPSEPSGTNVICYGSPVGRLSGSVIFVGYPPLPTDLVCETHDLVSAVCTWNKGRNTHLSGRRGTRYSLNNRSCAVENRANKQESCRAARWERHWLLEAVNQLGKHSLTDSADLRHRVSPVEPTHLTAVVNAWNATLLWQWKYDSYSSLALVCQVELTSPLQKSKRTFTGVGLTSAVLSDLYPDDDVAARVRCGAQQNFWKWGNWSEVFSFKTKMDVPDAPDVWWHISKPGTGHIAWKPLSPTESHGPVTEFEVTLWSPEENVQFTKLFPEDSYYVPINFTQTGSFSNVTKVMASVVAKNAAGVSPASSVVIPLLSADQGGAAAARAVYGDRGFPLRWQAAANDSCGYVLSWHSGLHEQDRPFRWIRVDPGSNNVSAESDNFEPGVRYYFSLYSCSSELLQRWQGYKRELAPSSSVPRLSVGQRSSDVVLSWGEIPLLSRRGFLLGYNIYISKDSQFRLLANLSGREIRSYRVKSLSEGFYKFTVKSYTSAGEDPGRTASITLTIRAAEMLIMEILTSLGITALFLIIVTFICYKKRKWVKTAFYPNIPEPKLSDDWPRAQGTLDVKPFPHSMVHIVEKPEWDSSKEALVAIPEEDEEEDDLPIDTDEPASLRYYNQMVDERPIRPRFPDLSDSSASSMDSGHTDVTYTGIQTSGSSLVFQADHQAAPEGQQPMAGFTFSCGGAGGGYRPQMQPRTPSDDPDVASSQSLLEPQDVSAGGYKPQNSWHLDSPPEAGERGLAPSLGSPTSVSSVASTQFLLPGDGESEEHADEKRQLTSSAATWFTNLLSSTKP